MKFIKHANKNERIVGGERKFWGYKNNIINNYIHKKETFMNIYKYDDSHKFYLSQFLIRNFLFLFILLVIVLVLIDD